MRRPGALTASVFGKLMPRYKSNSLKVRFQDLIEAENVMVNWLVVNSRMVVMTSTWWVWQEIEPQRYEIVLKVSTDNVRCCKIKSSRFSRLQVVERSSRWRCL